MITEKMFKYYTSPNFVVESSYWTKVHDKLDTLEAMAEEDVANNRKIREKDEFKSNAEYQIYLMLICNYAWANRLNAVVDSSVTE